MQHPDILAVSRRGELGDGMPMLQHTKELKPIFKVNRRIDYMLTNVEMAKMVKESCMLEWEEVPWATDHKVLVAVLVGMGTMRNITKQTFYRSIYDPVELACKKLLMHKHMQTEISSLDDMVNNNDEFGLVKFSKKVQACLKQEISLTSGNKVRGYKIKNGIIKKYLSQLKQLNKVSKKHSWEACANIIQQWIEETPLLKMEKERVEIELRGDPNVHNIMIALQKVHTSIRDGLKLQSIIVPNWKYWGMCKKVRLELIQSEMDRIRFCAKQIRESKCAWGNVVMPWSKTVHQMGKVIHGREVGVVALKKDASPTAKVYVGAEKDQIQLEYMQQQWDRIVETTDRHIQFPYRAKQDIMNKILNSPILGQEVWEMVKVLKKKKAPGVDKVQQKFSWVWGVENAFRMEMC